MPVEGGRTSPEGSSGPLLFKRHRRYIRVSDPLIALKRTVRPLDSPQLQTARLVTALRQHRIPEIPPGLDIVPEQLTKKLYAQPHIGALWSAVRAVNASSNVLLSLCSTLSDSGSSPRRVSGIKNNMLHRASYASSVHQ